MSDNINQWEKIKKDDNEFAEDTQPGLNYWDDVWRRFKGNPLAMGGLVVLILIALLAIFGPMFSKYSYSDQQTEFGNIPPRFAIYDIGDGQFVYVHKELKIIEVSEKGELLSLVKSTDENKAKKTRTYDIGGKKVVLDYSLSAKNKNNVKGQKYQLFVDGQELEHGGAKKVQNKTFFLGSDHLGRDVWVRLLYGARISLTVGLVAAIVNMIVGVIYGGISGYVGGRIDNIMMRIVDIIQSIPLLLIVILLMIILNDSGLKTIILALGLVYWVSMARQVRGQVMSLKEQEFVLSAKSLGATDSRIIFKHLIPNALGPIVVSMTMSIPQAIFTESFLSFVGLGVSAPQASWGTLANDATASIRSASYQLVAASLAIAITMFAFNFVGNGLRDALDPKLRK